MDLLQKIFDDAYVFSGVKEFVDFIIDYKQEKQSKIEAKETMEVSEKTRKFIYVVFNDQRIAEIMTKASTIWIQDLQRSLFLVSNTFLFMSTIPL